MALRYYEGMFLFDSAEATKDMAAVLANVEALLKKHNSTIVKLEKWDDRKLAYDIGNVKRGTYIWTIFQCEPSEIQQMRRDAELNETMLRNMILEDEDMLSRIKEREELRKKREAEAAQAAAEGLPIEGDRGGRFGDRGGRFGDRDRGDRGDRGDRFPRRERPAPVAAEDIEVPEELNQ